MDAAKSNNACVQVGEIKVIRLVDSLGPFPFLASKLFANVPAEDWPGLVARYPGSFSSPTALMGLCSATLVRTGNTMVLVDTANGPEPSPNAPMIYYGQLLARLAQAGVAPGDIDLVFLTHLHPDHVGWNVRDGKPTFRNARYLVHQADWQAAEALLAARPEAAGHVRAKILPLREQGVLDLLSGETEIATGLRAIETPGHTPGHMSLVVGERLLIVGDAFYHPLQIEQAARPFALDGDPAAANATRARLLEQMETQAWLSIACHFPEPGFGQVRRQGEGRIWEPLLSAQDQTTG